MTNEELYLTGLHIEQYRHATYLPDPYYLEGAGGTRAICGSTTRMGFCSCGGTVWRAEKHFSQGRGACHLEESQSVQQRALLQSGF